MPQGQPDSKELGYYFALAEIGLEMVFPMGVGILLDYHFHWTPWATLSGFALGFIGGFVHLLMLVKQQDETERSKSESRRR